MTDKVNGYSIIAQAFTPIGFATRAGRIVLVKRGPQYHDPFVTAWQGRDKDGKWDNGWHGGHYFESGKEALEDFSARCLREALAL